MKVNDIAKKYQKLDPIEHVLKRPGMYIGGIDEIENNIFVLDGEKIISKKINYSPGLYKIFDEIIVNAYDQTVRDTTVNTIKVNFQKNKNEISVFNNGKGIDVVIHPKEKIYVPELIFGHLRTSTSFGEESRITGGIHGLGAKLTAILSIYFKVEVGDTKNKKKFTQIYKNNLKEKSKPIIEKYTGPEGYVKITFKPDLKYFKLKEISEDLWNLFSRRVYDISALTKPTVKVYLDGKRIPINNFESYVTLFFPSIKHDEQHIIIKEKCHERWYFILTPSKHGFTHVSFVNGIYTENGGKHVDYIMNRIVKELKDMIQRKHKQTVSSQFIRDKFKLFLASVIEDPTFSSQTKDELMTPPNKFGSQCNISDQLVKRIYQKLDFATLIKQHIKYMESLEISKTDVKKKKTLKDIPKLYDANFSGTTKSNQCTLILTEGDSAKTMAISGLSAIKKWNDTFGVFPLKGKLINVRDASHNQLINNNEFINLKKIIGLTSGKVYNKDNLHELRYGHIMLMMDADVDGSHIKGLFINMVHHFWPSLLEIDGFIKMFVTPIVKVSKGKESYSFYSLPDYEKWKNKTKNYSQWNIKYYKGLGTSTAEEAKEYFLNLGKNTINFKIGTDADRYIKLAFSKDMADDRKKWLKKYDHDIVFNYNQKNMSYKDFINKEMIHFSNSDNIRSIPSVMDGFKPSQRKVLFGSFKKNLVDEIKVSRFVGYVSEISSYHHGEASLANTIIGMAQKFVGSNNVNLLDPKGQFGSRLMGGKDHSSPRYIFTQLMKITRNIFIKDDDYILNYLDDDGFQIEPDYYIPIIPMVLVNGAEGIGTGYSTMVPKYNVVEIIDNFVQKIKGEKFQDLKPYYSGFKGQIVKKDKYTYLTKGKYKREGNIVTVTELPITLWTETYKSFLENTLMEKSFVSSVKSNSTETDVYFTIKFNDLNTLDRLEKDGDKFVNGLEKLLLLVKVINMGNMHLFNNKGEIMRYSGPVQIMEEFYDIRLEYYGKRKKYLLDKLEHDINILDSKIKFIDMIVSKKNVVGIEKKKLVDILKKDKFYLVDGESEYDYIFRIPVYSMTKEKIVELNDMLKDKKNQYDKLKKKSLEYIWTDDLLTLKKFFIM